MRVNTYYLLGPNASLHIWLNSVDRFSTPPSSSAADAPPARHRSPRYAMSSPWVAAGRAFFATENSALMYLAKAEVSVESGAWAPARACLVYRAVALEGTE